jgi:hypothetical protein
MARVGADFLARGGVPAPQGRVPAARVDGLAISRDGDREDRAAVPAVRRQFLARSGVPAADRRVVGDGQRPAVGREGQGVEGAGVSLQAPHFPAGVHVQQPDAPRLPDEQAADPGDHRQHLAVGAESERVDVSRRGRPGGPHLARGRLPQTDPVGTARGHELAVGRERRGVDSSTRGPEPEPFLAGGHFPNVEVAVAGAHGQRLAVRGQGQAAQGVRGLRGVRGVHQVAHGLPGRHVPEDQPAVPAG